MLASSIHNTMQSKRPQTFVTNIKCKEVFYIIHNTKQ